MGFEDLTQKDMSPKVTEEQRESLLEALPVRLHEEDFTQSDQEDYVELFNQLRNDQDSPRIEFGSTTIRNRIFGEGHTTFVMRGPTAELPQQQERVVVTGTLVSVGEKNGSIEDVVAHEYVRGLGFGEKVMNALLEEARSQGISALELTSSPSREAAHKLYKRLGFEEVGTRQKHDKEGTPTHKTSVFKLLLDN